MLEYSYSSVSLSVEFEVHLVKDSAMIATASKKIGDCH